MCWLVRMEHFNPFKPPEAQVRSSLQVRVWHFTSHVQFLSHRLRSQ